jgi:peptidyl-prolyl cis-trans isomerase C
MKMTRLAKTGLSCALLGVTLAATLVGSPAMAQNAAMVNNKPISKAKVDEFVKAMVAQGRPDNKELRDNVVNELIARELFVQEAEKLGLARNPDVQKQLESARTEIMSQAVIRDYVKKNPVSDADMKAEYERISKQGTGKQYKTRHILVEKEDAAKKVIEDIKKGAKFEDLAKAQSKDPGSAQNGGDLDWVSPGSVVPPFAEAMAKLEKGKMTETPVQSNFGWHVIRVEDTRDAKPPSFEEVKPQMQQFLQQKKVASLVEALKAKATIK